IIKLRAVRLPLVTPSLSAHRFRRCVGGLGWLGTPGATPAVSVRHAREGVPSGGAGAGLCCDRPRRGMVPLWRFTTLSATPSPTGPRPSPDPLHVRFLALVPCIETYARMYFRDIRCPVTQEDRAQECVALGWQGFLRLTAQGKDV